MVTKRANQHSPGTNTKRSQITFAITCIALSLGHLGARLLGLPAQSLFGSPGTLPTGRSRGGVVILWKICWHNFLRHQPQEKTLEKLALFEKSMSCGRKKDRKRQGRGGVLRKGVKKRLPQTYSLVQSYSEQHDALDLMIAQFRAGHLHSLITSGDF